MKSIERRFNLLEKKNPYWSTLICFSEAIYYQRFNRQAIQRWFNKLVDTDDYAPEDKKAILENLERATNTLRTTKNEGKSALGRINCDYDD